jgi:hypothetical protein
VERELNEKENRRSAQLAHWRKLSKDQKAAAFRAAIDQSQSEFTRSRLRRHRGLDNPPTEVLALLAGDRGLVAEESPAPSR